VIKVSDKKLLFISLIGFASIAASWFLVADVKKLIAIHVCVISAVLLEYIFDAERRALKILIMSGIGIISSWLALNNQEDLVNAHIFITVVVFFNLVYTSPKR